MLCIRWTYHVYLMRLRLEIHNPTLNAVPIYGNDLACETHRALLSMMSLAWPLLSLLLRLAAGDRSPMENGERCGTVERPPEVGDPT